MSAPSDRRRLLVNAARSDGPSLADRDRIRLALAVRLGGGVLPPGGSNAPASGPQAGSVGPEQASPVAQGAAAPSAGLSAAFVVAGVASVATLAVAAFLTLRPGPDPRGDAGSERTSVVAVEPSGPEVTTRTGREGGETMAAPRDAAASAPVTEEPRSAVAVDSGAESDRVAAAERAPTVARPAPPSAALPSPARPRVPRSSGGLAEEVEMLRRAREATREGDGARALDVLDELERRQPDGALGEERRASRIVALCASERAEEGRGAARTFLAEMPSSIHAERVRAACDARSAR